jgi:ABC-2 type transport system permease protein
MPLSVWRVEWLRLLRTGRLVVLAGTFVFFGITGPVMTRYMSEILAHSANSRVKIIAAAPVPADGIASYTKNAMMIGMIVAVIVTAIACTVDAKPALGVYYRSRAARFADLLVPRVVVTGLAVVAAHLCGMLAAWFETASLLGAPNVSGLLQATALQSLYLLFAVCVTALASTLVRGALGAVGAALADLLLIPILQNIPALAHWAPSALTATPAALAGNDLSGHYPTAIATTLVLSAGALTLALLRGARAGLR